jgi:prophage DNA circulation protein
MPQKDAFSQLQQASYDGVVFPLITARIMSGSDAAFHKFPHRPGQRIEYMGRQPVTGVLVAPMFADLILEGNGRSEFWPNGVAELREKAQQQKSSRLVVPVWGTLDQAYVTMVEEYDANRRDGCLVTLTFAEDRGDLIAKGAQLANAAQLQKLASSLDNDLAALKIKLQNAIEDAQGNSSTDFVTAIGAFLALKDQAETAVLNRITMAERVVGAVDELFRTAASTLSDPINWQVRDALLDLKDGVTQAGKSASSAARAVRAIRTSAETTVVDIAAANSNSVADVIALNALPDPGRIDAGEIVLVYEAA